MFIRGGCVCGAASDGMARPTRLPIPLRLLAAFITGDTDPRLGGSGWLAAPVPPPLLAADGGGTLVPALADIQVMLEPPPAPDAAPAPPPPPAPAPAPAAPAIAPAPAAAAEPRINAPVAT